MIPSAHHLIASHSQKFSLKLLAISTLSTVSVLLGFVPSVSYSPSTINFESVAHAQEISNADVESYARSVLQINARRREALSQMRNVLGRDSVPSIVCNRPDSFDNQPREVRQIAVDYCEDSANIVKDNNLDTRRFNAITMAQESDSTLAERIRQALIRLQRNPQ